MNSIFPNLYNFTKHCLRISILPYFPSVPSFLPSFLSFNQRAQAYIKLQQKKVLGYAAYKQTAEFIPMDKQFYSQFKNWLDTFSNTAELKLAVLPLPAMYIYLSIYLCVCVYTHI